VRAVVDVLTGAVVQEMEYDEFGVVLSDTNPGFQPFGFAGGLYDADTGLVRFGARDYDAEVGRWAGKDPIRVRPTEANRYVYARNDPASRIDPKGESTIGTACFVGCFAICSVATKNPFKCAAACSAGCLAYSYPDPFSPSDDEVLEEPGDAGGQGSGPVDDDSGFYHYGRHPGVGGAHFGGFGGASSSGSGGDSCEDQ
jgi:RHS repeat-associated protein